MKKIETLALVALVVTTLCMPLYGADQNTISRREQRIESQIQRLTKELAEERYNRGIDTTTVVNTEPQTTKVETESTEIIPAATAVTEERDYTMKFNAFQVDSLLSLWREMESSEHFDNFYERYINIHTSAHCTASTGASKSEKAHALAVLDTLYTKRLTDLASPIGLPYNIIVRDYINRYVSPSSSLMSHILARSKYYFPMIEEELMKHDMPVELRAMAVIESALVASAMSRAGAAGLWQFMPATGKVYNLEVNFLVDERCDPYKSTIAACQFMKDLYKIYGDWSLAIAAYNCGPGNVNKALARSGLKEGTFWDIYDYLPRETRGYVPAFIAASYAYSYYKQHNIEAFDPPITPSIDTVTVTRILHLGQVAQSTGLPIEAIRDLNPQFRRDIIPATTRNYTLRLPQLYIAKYIQNEESMHAQDSLFLKQYIHPANIEKLRKTPSGTIYVVKKGDTLSGIASRYNTSSRQLMAWNNLRSAHKLSIGQRLRVR